MNYYLGIDFGTSGARAITIDDRKNIIDTRQLTFTEIATDKLAQVWQNTLFSLIRQIPLVLRKEIRAIAFAITSKIKKS